MIDDYEIILKTLTGLDPVEVDEIGGLDPLNFRSRSFVMVLWDEDKRHMLALNRIKLCDDYLFIHHDKDEKPHYHVFLRFKNARYRQAVANLLKIPYNYIFKPKTVPGYIRYMCHRGDAYKDKHQYSTQELHGSLKSWAIEIVDAYKPGEDEKTRSIYEWLDIHKTYVSFTSLWKFADDIGCGKIVRRQPYFWKIILNDHNQGYVSEDIENKFYKRVLNDEEE